MQNTIEAVVKNGRIIPIIDVELPEGSKAIVTILDDEDSDFWLSVTAETLKETWDNEEDDVYAELLSK